MKKRYLSFILLIMSLLTPLKAQIYTKMWKELEILENEDLPQSVVAKAMKIYDKAKAEQNVPQMMKAYLTAMKYRTFVTPDSLEKDRKGLEEWALKVQRPADKAVLYSILGEMTLEDNMKKGLEFFTASLQERDQLLLVSANDYAPVVKAGETSRKYFDNNLYDLLARRAVQEMQNYEWQAANKGIQTHTLPEEVKDFGGFMHHLWVKQSDYDLKAATLEVYRQLLEAYDTDTRRDAWILTAVDALEYLFRHFSVIFTNEVCRQELRAWIEKYSVARTMPEAYLLLARMWQYQDNQVERLKIIREGISRYPAYEGINRLKNIEKEILAPFLSISVGTAYPGKEHELHIRYKNLTGMTLQLYKVNLPITSAILSNRIKGFEKKYASLQQEEHFNLKATTDYLKADSTLCIQVPGPGIYYLKAIPDSKQGVSDGTVFYVTSLNSIYRPLPDGGMELVVVDAATGHPVPEAEVVTYTQKGGGYALQQVYRTNAEGTVKLDLLKDRNVLYNVRTLADTGMPISHLWKNLYPMVEESTTKTVLQLFTDRSFYRPGQTVYVSGMAYEMQQDKTSVLADKAYTVSLYDAAHNQIGKIDVKTNAFGSFSGLFVLPSSCLTGCFTLESENISAEFRVEEYKRPTFDVTFEPVATEYKEGDSICVIGVAKTFAGASVQNAKVRYNIVRSFAWRWNYEGSSANWEGETITDSEGKFHVLVRLEVGQEVRNMRNWYYDYKITAEVTDGAGETQQGNLLLPLGAASICLDVKIPTGAYLIKEKQVPVQWIACNLKGELVNTQVSYRMVRLETDGRGRSTEKECVLNDTARSNCDFMPSRIYQLASGHYRLYLSAHDKQGRECTETHDVVLFSLNDTRPPQAVVDWFYQDGDKFSDTLPATLYLGSNAKDVYLFYDVYAGNKCVESRRIQFSDSLLTFRFPYKEEYGEGIGVSLVFVKEGQLYSHYARIEKNAPQKVLNLKWNSFRDKLSPGQQEEWRLSVFYPDGRPAEAELIATLYDASLDGLYHAHRLPFRLDFHRSVPVVLWNLTGGFDSYFYVNFSWQHLKEYSLDYSRLDIPYPARLDMHSAAYSRGGLAVIPRLVNGLQLQKQALAKDASAVDNLVLEEESVVMTTGTLKSAALADTGEEEAGRQVLVGNTQLRQNFAETAFFYPQLRTDEKGEVSIAFILPESLTRWKFLALAHTREVDHGTLEAVATASKEFMLQPNMPRFVRIGDKACITASLVNVSDRAVKGVVRMELFNPETENVFYTQKQKFSVLPGETKQVEFAFTVTDKSNVLACRMVADGDTFSDGEQRYIPVLTDRQWVTETLSLSLSGAGEQILSLEHLFGNHSHTATAQRLTIELTGNPAWYAVQALPVVAEPQNDDALSWAAAYYAHSLAAYVTKVNPRIQAVFQSWLAQGGNQEIFLSNLQKNPELKNILQVETPWLAEAIGEAEQKQRVATLFQLNTMMGKLSLAAAKLGELQNAEGAWSWYKGMQGNRYVTTQIAMLLARLRVTTTLAPEVQTLYDKALQFLAREVGEEYKYMREAEKRGTHGVYPSELVLRFLYICALDNRSVADPKVNRYFIDKLAAGHTELSIYGKALGAIILYHDGRTTRAQELMRSLMEYSVVTPEMGRYFDTPKAQYSWFSYKIPTHVAAMEAIRYITQDMKTIEEMKLWLLKQKQVQVWDTPIATVDAVYALLTGGGGDLLSISSSLQVKLDKEMLVTPTGDALGYTQKTWHGNDAIGIKKLILSKEGEGMSWGAVYAQYLEDTDRVTVQGNALSIIRSLYKGEQLLDGSVPLAVGDKITVRLTVKADRDMDFVQIKDERPACMEPLESLSGYRWNGKLGYYQATGDASTRFFVDQMRKGTYVIEYQVYINRAGEYQSGSASVQSAYAPEFAGHTAGSRVTVR